MALTSAILMTAGAVTSATGSYYAAQGQKAALKADAAIGEINAKQAEQDARDTLLAGQRERQQVLLAKAQTKSAQRTAMAANGVDLSSDSAVNVLTSTDYIGELDANAAETNAIRSAWSYRTDATNMRNGANMSRATAKGISPTASAVTSLLGSSGQVANSWYSASQSDSWKKAGSTLKSVFGKG